VRIITLAPELPGALEAIAALAPTTVVSLGHSEASLDQAVSAADRGATAVTHVFNAMARLDHRAPGLAGAALSDDRLTPCVIGDGVHVHPSVLKMVLSAKSAVLVSDSVAWEGTGLTVAGGAARLPDGTLAGSVVTLAEAVGVAVHQAGVPLATALAAASATPAALVGDAAHGVIRAGCVADLVAFGPELAVVGVWVGGQALA
jgi:N-acetylglucosamine-6-phosphate deacetylase